MAKEDYERQPIAEPEGPGDYHCGTCGEYLGFVSYEADFAVRRQHTLPDCVRWLAWTVAQI